MNGIDGDRRENRKDVFPEVLVERRLFLVRELVRSYEGDSCSAQLAAQRRVPNSILLCHELVNTIADGRELLFRREPVRRHLVDFTEDLRLQAGDADHEELVQVAGENRTELEPLVERYARVGGFGQDACVELEPRELAVDVEGGLFQPRNHGQWDRARCGSGSARLGRGHDGRRKLVIIPHAGRARASRREPALLSHRSSPLPAITLER